MYDDKNHPLLSHFTLEAICAAVKESEQPLGSVVSLQGVVNNTFKSITKHGRSKLIISTTNACLAPTIFSIKAAPVCIPETRARN